MSSPEGEVGVRPFQPRRRDEVEEEEVEMANVVDVDVAIFTPSIYAESVLVEEEPV